MYIRNDPHIYSTAQTNRQLKFNSPNKASMLLNSMSQNLEIINFDSYQNKKRFDSEKSTLSLARIAHSNSTMDIRAIELKRKNIERFEK